jgi:hypothetical protein
MKINLFCDKKKMLLKSRGTFILLGNCLSKGAFLSPQEENSYTCEQKYAFLEQKELKSLCKN